MRLPLENAVGEEFFESFKLGDLQVFAQLADVVGEVGIALGGGGAFTAEEDVEGQVLAAGFRLKGEEVVELVEDAGGGQVAGGLTVADAPGGDQ